MLALWLQLMALFAKVSVFTYGGGLASIPFLYDAFVLQLAWLTAESFTQIVSLAQMTPGPIIINSATLLGFRYGGIVGALLCTFAVAAAPLVIVSAIMVLTAKAQGSAKYWVDRVRKAMRPVVAAMIVASLYSLTKPLFSHPKLFILTALTGLGLWSSSFLRAYPQLLLFGCALLTLGLSFLGLSF